MATVGGCASNRSRPPKIHEGEFGSRIASLEVSKVEKMTLFYESEGVLPFEPIDEKHLEVIAQGTLTIKKFQFAKMSEALIRSLKVTSMVASDDVALDVRWGCVLYDRHNNVLLSIYLNTDGSGLVDQTKVRTDGKFLDFLREQFRWLTDMW
jgi:hypothetical protein